MRRPSRCSRSSKGGADQRGTRAAAGLLVGRQLRRRGTGRRLSAGLLGSLCHGGRLLRAGARRQPHVEHRVQQRIEPRAFGEHPAREDALLLAVEHDLVDLDERGGAGWLGRRAGVAGARRDLEGAELAGLIERHADLLDGGRHLVEGGEHRHGVVDALGVRRHIEQADDGAASAGRRALPILLRNGGIGQLPCAHCITSHRPVGACAGPAPEDADKRGASVAAPCRHRRVSASPADGRQGL